MPHASLRISRTIMSSAQTAPVFDVTSDSTARHAPSPLTLYPPPCAVPRAAPSRRLPRNPYSIALADIRQESLPTSAGRSVGYDPRPHTPPLDGSGDTMQSKSTVSWPSSAQTTTIHPTPAPGARPPPASRKVPAHHLLFFYPARHCIARDAEGARQSTQTAAFVVGPQDSFALFSRVGIGARPFATPLTALMAQVALAAIGSQTVAHQACALAILTSKNNRHHDWTLPCHLHVSHYLKRYHIQRRTITYSATLIWKMQCSISSDRINH